ncbi:baseplate J/gp47 family protein [Streptomyces sp. NPDC007818]|uniref:baseplate J/gp47 family protein n=1 Tax=Streptomyces sp. NPDC007818 TaxID=3364780 RepID=UPI0036CABD6E
MSRPYGTGVPAVAGGLVSGVDADARRTLVREGAPSWNGIDSVEVLVHDSASADAREQRAATLLVRLLRAPAPGLLSARTVRVLGGVRPDPRLNPVGVLWAHRADAVLGGGPPPAGVTAEDRTLVERATSGAPGSRDRVLVVRTDSAGDWSTYVLALTGDDGSGPPAGFDAPLARAAFTFTVDCPSALDCAAGVPVCPPGSAASPVLDYLARDYEALRTRLLDRLRTLLPDWTDHSPADPAVTLAELFAALGDRLAAWQDGVAAEAYLSTARRRTSVRRHARLLDHRMGEGVSARVWLAFRTDVDGWVARGTPVTEPFDGGLPPETVEEALAAGAVVFETCAGARITTARNALALHSWGDPDHCLPTGATSAFLRHPKGLSPDWQDGHVLLLVPRDRAGTRGAEGRDGMGAARRQAVRLVRAPVAHDDPLYPGHRVLEVHWAAEDALRVPLPVTGGLDGGLPVTLAEALANVVLADHGGTVTETLAAPGPVQGARPRLGRTGLAWTESPPVGPRSAAAALRPDPRRAEPRIVLDDGLRRWSPATDLLSGDRLAATFIVETENDGTTRLRFGDGVSARRPAPDAPFVAAYRIGGGSAGNVAAGALATVLTRPGLPPLPAGARVANPLPAAGGTDPETLDEVRQLAPHAFRFPLRAVTSADHAEVAMRHPGVQRAVARRRWTGSWYAQEVALDPLSGADDPAAVASLAAEVAAVLETHRMTGTDVRTVTPVHVPLELVADVCVLPGHRPGDVVADLARAFSAGVLPDGRPGFFHPDRFTFGTPLFLSDVVATAMGVPGVAWVDVGDDDQRGLRFRRLGRPPADEVRRGRVDAAPREVLRADSDPGNPERGRVSFRPRSEP